MDGANQLKLIGALGILDESDLPRLIASEARVLDLMRDGRWHTPDEIRLAAGRNGRPASEGLRRMRNLKKQGFIIDKKRVDDSMTFVYRLSSL